MIACECEDTILNQIWLTEGKCRRVKGIANAYIVTLYSIDYQIAAQIQREWKASK